MGKKAAKATRKFAQSGELQRKIQERRKHAKVKKEATQRQAVKSAKARDRAKAAEDKGGKSGAADDDSGAENVRGSSAKSKFGGMSVDDFMGGGFLDGAEDDDDPVKAEGEDDSEDDGEDGSDDDDNSSFASIDELEDEGEAHMQELSALAKKDPEFYKYLQDNDRELLDFKTTGPSAGEEDASMDEAEESNEEEKGEEIPQLTSQIIRGWQKGILEHRSLRAFRKLLVAFRTAANMTEDEGATDSTWRIDSPTVFNKLVVTTLKYTPVVLMHHIPYKSLPNGKLRPPADNEKRRALRKPVLSYFRNVMNMISHLTDADMLHMAVTEVAKVIPYIVDSRKAVKDYLKMCLNLWSTAEDKVRIAAFLAMRRLVSASDEAVGELVMKGSYLTLVRTSKSTSTHTLPSINLMKNSATEIYCTNQSAAYQLAFGYIRQLAIHLRNSMKVKSKDAFKQVYNWQFVHCVDFWCIVLARACSFDAEAESGEESDLKPLIYPLVQITLGAIKLIPTPRYYPLHFHLLRSILHLAQNTRTYIPLAPFLLPIITSTAAPTSRPKPSTLRPLDLQVHIRAPAQYLKTRVYVDGICEEAVFLLAEWCESAQSSIAFPEVIVPIVTVLRRSMKKAGKSGGGKAAAGVKVLVERVEEGAKWISSRRESVTFAPGMRDQVARWESEIKVEETPLGKWLSIQRKAREKRRKLVEKAKAGEGELLDN